LFELQGHRGARGLKPENTLPAFEAALDAGASSVETDLRLTRDGAVVLCHDPVLDGRLLAPTPGAPVVVSAVGLDELRRWRPARNPDAARFPGQDADPTPLAWWYFERLGLDPFVVPTLADLFAFAAAYAGRPGAAAGKTAAQRDRARALRFDLELKGAPFRPDADPAALEGAVVEAVRRAGVAERTAVRSFDHRRVRRLRRAEPRLTGAVLLAHAAPAAPAEVARRADAQVYCPSFDFVDAELVREAHAEGVRVLPWTLNEPDDWRRLLDWGVDGLTTDHPDRLAERLRAWGVPW
jgi:glycerophosphoryl diester phosphodiesterase